MKRAATCLQIDVGNSAAKWRLIVDNGVQSRGTYLVDDAESQQALLDCSAALDQIWIASVASPAIESRLAVTLEQRWNKKPWFARTQSTSCGLTNSYSEPGRMGVDRWLAMLAAWRDAGERVCVVDAGSALTIDLVAADGQHEGGFIIPGASLMERALFLDTDRVRFAEDVGFGLAPGRSTAEAVRHGISLAQAGAVRLALARSAEPAPQLVYSGGGGQLLMALADEGGEYRGDLVFEGLQLMAEADSESA
ncbi:MAG: type III pantothenate kinase [Pseudomonadota bacterium]